MDWKETAQGALDLALAGLVPVVIAFAAAWLKAQIRRLNAKWAQQIAEAAVTAVEAEAEVNWDGPRKKAEAEAKLRNQGAAFAIPYVEQAVAWSARELSEIAARKAVKRAAEESSREGS